MKNLMIIWNYNLLLFLKAEKIRILAFIEWYNDNKKINEFIILYVDINSENRDVWIQREINVIKGDAVLY